MKALVVGVGKLGYRLAAALIDENYEVTVIDNNKDVIENVTSTLDVMSINANALDFGVLEQLNMEEYDYVIATTTNDEANLILCTISKKMGTKFAIARVRDPEYRRHLKFVGTELDIDKIINPDYATAKSIVKYLLKRYQLYSDEFAGGRVSLVEFNIRKDESFVGKKIMDIEEIKDLLIAAISRNGEAIIPNGKTLLKENDTIILAGRAYSIEEFDKAHTGVEKAKKLKNVMILGGGKTGLYVAMLLLKEKVNVTIVEIDKDRSMMLKEIIPQAQIINGDGTDISLLQDEMINTYDAFVAATGIDEVNMLMALVTKEDGMYKSVAKTSRTNYDKIIDKLNIDCVFNTSYITAAVMLKEMRGKNSLSLNLFLNGQVEGVELEIKKKHFVCDKSLKEIKLPDGILIVGIVRDMKMIVPNGDTVLKENDRIIVFSKHDQALKMKKIFFAENKITHAINTIRNRSYNES